MSTITERFVVERDALVPLCDSNAASVLSGEFEVLTLESDLLAIKRQLAETQAQLGVASGLICSLVKPHLEPGADKLLPDSFIRDCVEFTKTAALPKAVEADFAPPDGRIGLMAMAARAEAKKHQASQALATRLLNEPFYQPTECEMASQPVLHTDIIAFREKYLRALDLIDRMYLIHRHEPIFSEDDEDIANELGTELLRYIQARDKLTIPRPLVCQQQDTISALRKLTGELQAEVKMLRSYEGEWGSLLAVESEEKELAHQLLRIMANRMGHEDFGPLRKEIEKFLDSVRTRKLDRESAMYAEVAYAEATEAEEQGMKTVRILPLVGLKNCDKCKGTGRTTVMDDDGIWCDTSCPACNGSGKQIKGDA